MHNIRIIKRNRKMKFQIQRLSSGFEYALPLCDISKAACEFANEKYLFPAQLKQLEKLGFSLEYEKESVESTSYYLRGD